MDKNQKTMNKAIKQAIRKDVNSVQAIIIFYVLGVSLWLALNLIFYIMESIFNNFEYFEMYLINKKKIIQVICNIIYMLIYALVLKSKIRISDSKDFLQKFITTSLCISCITTFLITQNSKKSTLNRIKDYVILEPIYYNVLNAELESDYYKEYKKFLDEPNIKDYRDLADYLTDSYYDIVDTEIYEELEQIFYKTAIEILGMIICIKILKLKN